MFICAARNFDQVDSGILQPFGHLQAVFERKAAFLEIGAVELHRNREVRADERADSVHREHQDARSVFEAAAPAIIALVRARAQELRKKVTMRRVDLHPGKADFLAHPCRSTKAADDVQDFILGHGDRLTELTAGKAEFHRRWCLGMRIDRLLRLPTGMADLRPEMVAIARCRRGPMRKGALAILIRLAVDNHIAGALQMVGIDMDISRKQHPGTTFAPCEIEPVKLARGAAVNVG